MIVRVLAGVIGHVALWRPPGLIVMIVIARVTMGVLYLDDRSTRISVVRRRGHCRDKQEHRQGHGG